MSSTIDTHLAPDSEKTHEAEENDLANKGAEAQADAHGKQQPQDGEQPPGGDGEDAEGKSLLGDEGEAEPEGPPEAYEFTAPDGTELDSHVVEQFESVARELNLTNTGAQKILDRVLPAMVSRAQEMEAAQRKGWRDAIKADRDIGGDKLKESLAVAVTARDRFGDEDFAQLLKGPLGDNPAVIRFLHKVGSQISEDRHVTGSGTAREELDMRDPAARAQAFYGNQGS